MESTGTARPYAKARVARLGVIAVLCGAIALLVIVAANTPGNSTSGDGFVERVLSDADGVARVTVPLELKEADPSHEAGHVFDSVTGLRGVRTARLVFAERSLVLTYDPKVASEAAIRDALRAAGYLAGEPAKQ